MVAKWLVMEKRSRSRSRFRVARGRSRSGCGVSECVDVGRGWIEAERGKGVVARWLVSRSDGVGVNTSVLVSKEE